MVFFVIVGFAGGLYDLAIGESYEIIVKYKVYESAPAFLVRGADLYGY